MKAIISVSHKALLALVACAALILSGVSAYAQTAAGKVIDTNGVPVIGAAVMVPGTTTGVTTDIDGNFQLNVAPGTTLEVSCIGYVTKNVVAAANMSIVLEEDAEMLEETVVIGYGSVKRSDLTSAVAKMDDSAIADRPMARAEQALQGQLAGVTVQNTNNEPGADPQIRVRGAASLSAGSDPLYIIDGVPNSTLQGVNPNDIASIEVLKDAASAAIYGSRGSNGVILVTTKTGQKGAPRVSFNASYGLATLERKMDLLKSVEFMEFRLKYIDEAYIRDYGGLASDSNAQREANGVPSSNFSYRFDDRWLQYLSAETQAAHNYVKGTGEIALIDWQDYVYSPAGTQNYNISVSGANDRTNYMFSLGYMDQEGLGSRIDYKRISARMNVESKLNDWVAVGLNLAPSFIIHRGAGSENGKDKIGTNVLNMTPLAEADAGVQTNYYPYLQYDWGGSNTLYKQYYIDNAATQRGIRLQGTTFIRLTPIKDLSITGTASANYTSNDTNQYSNDLLTRGRWLTNAEGTRATASHSTSWSLSTLLQIVANYNKSFNKHTIDLMVGASSEYSNLGWSTSQSFNQLANDTITGTFSGNSTTTTPTVKGSSYSQRTPTRLYSAFARAQYNYDSRYLLTASIRRDGYSRFGANSKWGWFPSASAGWVISNEPFFKNSSLDWWDTFKFRASYGETGNYGIGESAAYSTLSSSTYNDGIAYYAGSFGNQDLGWEHTKSVDIAADLAFLNNRIQVSIDWYNKLTDGLLYSVPVPSVFGTSNVTQNLGSILNRGIELELNTHNIQNSNFSWSTSFNVSYNHNEVLQLGAENTPVLRTNNGAANRLEVGMPMYYFYGFKTLGVWMNQAEIDAYIAETGNTPKFNGTPIKPGDLKHEDITGDGNITNDDRQYLGKPTPDFTYGMTNTFRWKNFDASILFTAQTGGQIFGAVGRAIDRAGNGNWNVLGHWRDCWWSEDEPGAGTEPSVFSKVKPEGESRFVESSDYFRIKNITLGYSIPFKKFISSARVYLSVENVLLLTSYYRGYTPEATTQGSNFPGFDFGAFPAARTFTAGINVNF
ncbi:MAG: TonB-dependent receptor [Bacteroidales bacterium]|nr:TonB-dependent receptor [Bacteroidales bacterium]